MSQRVRRQQAALFGRRMDRARLHNFLTITQFTEDIIDAAREAGVDLRLDRSAVSRWLTGENEPHMKYRPHIAKVLQRDPHDLFEAVEEYALPSGVAS